MLDPPFNLNNEMIQDPEPLKTSPFFPKSERKKLSFKFNKIIGKIQERNGKFI